MIQVLNKATGEIYELKDRTPEQLKDSWLALSETIKACERAKSKLKPKVEELLNVSSVMVIGGYQFRRTITERKTYDKAVMREVLDPDDFDLLLTPDKMRIDDFIKEHLDDLGDTATKLRMSMVPVLTKDKTGEWKPMLPYTTVRLEKI